MADNCMAFEKQLLLGSGRDGVSGHGTPSDYTFGTGFYQIPLNCKVGQVQ